MTEAEWLAATDPEPMLQFVRDKTSDRKLRLFGVACCRRVARWMTDKRSLHAVDISEQFADRIVGKKRLSAARRDAYLASRDPDGSSPVDRDHTGTSHAAIVALNISSRPLNEGGDLLWTASCARSLVAHAVNDDAGGVERQCQVALLYDIFGNPFRPVAFDPSWRTSTVAALAEQMYESRDFSPMPVLADALQDAGCDNEDILAHCRGAGPHVRGCWVVDLILGKK